MSRARGISWPHRMPARPSGPDRGLRFHTEPLSAGPQNRSGNSVALPTPNGGLAGETRRHGLSVNLHIAHVGPRRAESFARMYAAGLN